ncbi:MAG: FecR domain-containing protein [Alphaproteobacteria bacterium]|nr:FecR domain-containing protein [Alphaproteobacteria bacterium]
MKNGHWILALGTVSSVALLAGSGLAQVAPQIGVTAAVNPATRSAPPQGQLRTMVIGNQVVSRERVVTEATGKAQILFLDQSAITIGQNSDLTLDEFVYSPERSQGELSASLAKGVMRFVGGRISKAGNVNFRTPSATIGIRGGIVLIDARSESETVVVFLFGNSATVQQIGGPTTVLRKAGFALRVPRQGPPQVFKPTPQQMAEWSAELEGTDPAGRAGASSAPGDGDLVRAGIVQYGSLIAPGEFGDVPGLRLLGDRVNGIHGIPGQNHQTTLPKIREKIIDDDFGY